ncbi:MAG: GntR family transcriptional regulator [Pseudomonadota bacterium]
MSSQTARSATRDGVPLYDQVRETLARQISSGELAPGAALPSEFQLAAQLGVSQGTVRKALNTLTRERLVVRRQGKGTFVVEQTPADVHFRFFNVFHADGRRVLPGSRGTRVRSGKANAEECARLRLAPGAPVWRIARLRTLEDRAFMRERVVLSAALFPKLDVRVGGIPNTLYDMFQADFGVLIVRASDAVWGAACPAALAGTFGIATGTPITVIDRVAYDLDDMPVEWRMSFGHLDGLVYRANVG